MGGENQPGSVYVVSVGEQAEGPAQPGALPGGRAGDGRALRGSRGAGEGGSGGEGSGSRERETRGEDKGLSLICCPAVAEYFIEELGIFFLFFFVHPPP